MAWSIGYIPPVPIVVTPQTGALVGTGEAALLTQTGQNRTDTIGSAVMAFVGAAPVVIVGGAAPTITSPLTLPAATNGQPYNYLMTAAGGSGIYYWTISGVYNSNLWMNGAGQWNGTPTLFPPSAAETDTITITCTDGITGLSASATFTLVINVSSGTLAFTTAATLPTAYVGQGYSTPIAATGGVAPYATKNLGFKLTSATSTTYASGFAYVTTYGNLVFPPTSAGSDTYTVSLTDNSGATISKTFTINVSAALAITSPTLLPQAMVGSAYKYTIVTANGTSPTQSITSGSLPPGMSFSNGAISGTPTGPGTYAFTVTASGGGTATQTFRLCAMPSTQVSRPSYNSTKTNGFFVLNGKLYDPNGKEFRIRGDNRVHFSNENQPGYSTTGSNYTRIWVGTNFGATYPGCATVIQNDHLNYGNFPLITCGSDPTSGSTNTVSTGSSSIPLFNNVMQYFWGSAASSFTAFNEKAGGNIINEYGGSLSNAQLNTLYQGVSCAVASISGTTMTLASSVTGSSNPYTAHQVLGSSLYVTGVPGVASGWSTIASVGGIPGAWVVNLNTSLGTSSGAGGTANGGAVAQMRALGYTFPLSIDLPNDGEDPSFLVPYANGVLTSDPLQNVIFACHKYYAKSQCFPISNVTYSGSTATITYAAPGYGATQPGTYLFQAGATIEGVNGINGINGLNFTNVGGDAGTEGAWKVNVGNGTFTGSYVSGGFLYDSYYWASNMATVINDAIAAEVMVYFEEFGSDYTATPTTDTCYELMIGLCEHYGIGYTPWAWDDNDETPITASLSKTRLNQYNSTGTYTTPNTLTYWGMQWVFDPQIGWLALAQPASYYTDG